MKTIKTVRTFTVSIYVGSREGRTGDPKPNWHSNVYDVCQKFCDAVGLCVTIKPLDFIYTNGREIGWEIGLINYPRFPRPHTDILDTGLELARLLQEAQEQMVVSVVTPDETYLLERESTK